MTRALFLCCFAVAVLTGCAPPEVQTDGYVLLDADLRRSGGVVELDGMVFDTPQPLVAAGEALLLTPELERSVEVPADTLVHLHGAAGDVVELVLGTEVRTDAIEVWSTRALAEQLAEDLEASPISLGLGWWRLEGEDTLSVFSGLTLPEGVEQVRPAMANDAVRASVLRLRTERRTAARLDEVTREVARATEAADLVGRYQSPWGPVLLGADGVARGCGVSGDWIARGDRVFLPELGETFVAIDDQLVPAHPNETTEAGGTR